VEENLLPEEEGLAIVNTVHQKAISMSALNDGKKGSFLTLIKEELQTTCSNKQAKSNISAKTIQRFLRKYNLRQNPRTNSGLGTKDKRFSNGARMIPSAFQMWFS
jgi:hypothetical protein